MVKHEFDCFINKNSKILILGSFPSVKSREEMFYYMHKSNRFYKVLAAIFDDENFLIRDVDIKKQCLSKYNIALYDVIESCEIALSDDNTIKNEIPIDLKAIIKNYPIEIIAINGNKAKELYLKYFNDLDIDVYFLPSTSARNASYNLDKLISKWKIIKIDN